MTGHGGDVNTAQWHPHHALLASGRCAREMETAVSMQHLTGVVGKNLKRPQHAVLASGKCARMPVLLHMILTGSPTSGTASNLRSSGIFMPHASWAARNTP